MASSLSDAAEQQQNRQPKIKFISKKLKRKRDKISNTQEEYAKDVLPSGFDLVGLTVDHLRHTANHHVADGQRAVAFHDVLERPTATT